MKIILAILFTVAAIVVFALCKAAGMPMPTPGKEKKP